MTPDSTADIRCILIGGRSNSGKSSVAAYLAGRLGWANVSTDTLGRHPGRPWGAVPDHVVAHYTSLDDAAILETLLAHQRGMWSRTESLVREYVEAGQGLVLEGSAIMPEETSSLHLSTVAAVWLTADGAFIRERIVTESGYELATAAARHLIDRFIERNQRLDDALRSGALQHGLPLVDVEGRSVAEVAEACLKAMRRLG